MDMYIAHMKFGHTFGTPSENLLTVWEDLMLYWEDHPPKDRYQNLKLSMFLNNEKPHDTQPKLKGRAHEVKSLVPALAHVWEHRMDPGKPEHAAVLQGLHHSAKMDDILDAFPDVDSLPDGPAHDFSEASWGYALCQCAVADHYNRLEGMLIFDVTIKTHYMLHQALQAKWFNPRKIWNYAGEDFMHKCKTLLESCVRGTSAPQAQNKFADKYRYALHYMFREFEEGFR